jgi:hypothetical protein
MIINNSGDSSLTPQRVVEFPDVAKRSHYDEILLRWRSWALPDRMFVGFIDEIEHDPEAILRRICNFLGIGFEAGWFKTLNEVVHQGIPADMPPEIYEKLKSRYEHVYRWMAKEYPEPCEKWLRKHYG